jgi:hypothetical protein
MGYLSNTSITVDAILTRKGRELLSKGQGFDITQFALADDEIDYGLWTPTHPLGTLYYGAILENTPLVEASPDETQVMRSKLVTLPKGTKQIPIISIGFASIILTAGQSAAFPIRPVTTQGFNGAGYGYTAILYDSDAAIIVGSGLPANFQTSVGNFLGDSQTAHATVVRGTEFTMTPKDVPSQNNTSLVIIGNETGAYVRIPVRVNPKPTP